MFQNIFFCYSKHKNIFFLFIFVAQTPAVSTPKFSNLIPSADNKTFHFECTVENTAGDAARFRVKFLFDGEQSATVPAVIVSGAPEAKAVLNAAQLTSNIGKDVIIYNYYIHNFLR